MWGRDLGRGWGGGGARDSVMGAPFEHEPLRAAQDPPGQVDCSSGRLGEPALPGLPPDGAASSAPLASATVALIKRTICLPLNQTQIPFPSKAPEASRDPGSPSRLHLPPQGPRLSFPSPRHYLPAPVWGKVCERPGLLQGPVPRTWGPPPQGSKQAVTAQDSKSRWPPVKKPMPSLRCPSSVFSSLPLASFVLSLTLRERQPYPHFTDQDTEAQGDRVPAQGHWGERMDLGPHHLRHILGNSRPHGGVPLLAPPPPYFRQAGPPAQGISRGGGGGERPPLDAHGTRGCAEGEARTPQARKGGGVAGTKGRGEGGAGEAGGGAGRGGFRLREPRAPAPRPHLLW